MVEKLDKAIPILTNLKNLYHSIKLSGKQALLKKVFESGLIYDWQHTSNTRLHSALNHNYQRMKEKKFFFWKPLEIVWKLKDSTTYGIRTRDSSVKGRRLNPLTNAAFLQRTAKILPCTFVAKSFMVQRNRIDVAAHAIKILYFIYYT